MTKTADEVEEFLLQFLGDAAKTPRQIRTKCTRTINKDAKAAEAWAARCWAQFQLGDHAEAISDANQAIKLCPDAYVPWYVRGSSYWNTGNNKKAETDLTKSIELAAGAKLFLEDALRHRGGLRCNDKRFDDALKDLNRCIKIDPDDVWAFVFRGNTYSGKKNFKKARQDYQHAIDLDDEDAYAIGTLAWFLATCPDDSMRDASRAMELATLANELSANEYLNDLVAAYAESGQFAKAVKAQKRAIKKCDDDEEKGLMMQRLKFYENEKPFRDNQ